MKVRVIRSFIDKYSMEDIDKDVEIEITEERFGELTTGPLGVFVNEIKKEPPENHPPEGKKEEPPAAEPAKEEMPKKKTSEK